MSLCTTGIGRSTSNILLIDFGALKAGSGPLGARMDGPELRDQLRELERELVEGPKGGFFLGEHPGRADIMLEYPLTSIKHRKTVDLAKEFPKLDEWLERCHDRPAFKRSLEKGNGYDLSTFPKPARL